MKPQPNSVWHNDWRTADVEPLQSFAPSLGASVIIPYYAAPRELELVLATLERQTYPRGLFDVIIVDDGSPAPLAPPDSPLNIKMIRQEDRGFGLARARNNGARASERDILIFLDCDILVEDDWLAAHARWHHAVSDVLTLGSYADVDVDDLSAAAVRRRKGTLADAFAGRPSDARPNQAHLIRTDWLTSRADDPFRAALGGNLGIGADFFREVGGCDESFTRWGLEEIEFAYRAYTRGGLLVPLPDAFGWHQGRLGDEGRDERARQLRTQRAKIAHLIPHRGIRGDGGGRIFAVPKYVVSINCENRSEDDALAATMRVLADGESDMAVRIETGGEDSERDAPLTEAFGPDPRVRVSPTRSALEDFPSSPFHIRIPAAAFGGGLTARLRAGLGDAVGASAALADGEEVSIFRAWALHRARRTGKTPADFGEVRALSPSVLKRRASARAGGGLDGAEPSGYPSPLRRLRDRAREIRGARGLWLFAKWLAYVARRETRNRRSWTKRRR